MAGLDENTPTPTDIIVHRDRKTLEVAFDDGSRFELPFEFLRVYSPSAEVRGHGPGQEVLQTGKREVGIVDLQLVGHYAVQPVFSDGHDSGLYTWEMLHDLGMRQQALWQDYLDRLNAAGVDRDAPMQSGAPTGGACASHGH